MPNVEYLHCAEHQLIALCKWIQGLDHLLFDIATKPFQFHLLAHALEVG
jgi:hypothetical protein